mmetsp:Transcript_39842/g.38406  ORF Transcript_39842/g.38406 Transcript_39842/m.38406 type:complete len:123 (+) Transcript_39842:180-548(+)|eukprot:CAMPEP_0170546762 /NCGR_PEP_ID=MMETSP0211-20121228/5094_1 /TAXON_ID=311385 /ORGANISM="Pseudokeronopsis sp., Strain OXSARD2" /LENGTH=122 /DNA_ID=CAMNT_0010851377 /DNA_START=180 /DNA_END=548 /DNA_ORIENTATION=-
MYEEGVKEPLYYNYVKEQYYNVTEFPSDQTMSACFYSPQSPKTIEFKYFFLPFDYQSPSIYDEDQLELDMKALKYKIEVMEYNIYTFQRREVTMERVINNSTNIVTEFSVLKMVLAMLIFGL